MNILVTGGAGFIGSHTIETLLSRGDQVVCLDNFDDYYDPSIKERNLLAASRHSGFRCVRGDIRDSTALEEAFARGPVDAVIHLAARAGVRPSLLQPELYYDVNVVGTLRLLEAMRKHKVARLVFGSSSSVYGNNEKVPFSETDPVDSPISPYAASKKAGELLCHTYHHLYGFHIFCLRFFTVYGPRQRPEMAIHQFTRKILNKEKILLYGDGTSQRDYTYIEDILEGLMRSLDRLNGYEIINLGESRTISLAALITAIERLTGVRAVIERQPMQPGDVMITYADTAKARALLGYSPRFPVEEGLAKFVEWYRNSQVKEGAL
jgi:UDP-glucuronate 4-epimerase